MALGMWKFRTLRDYWRVAQWLERQRAKGRQHQAMEEYFTRMTEAIKKGILDYYNTACLLDVHTGGMLSDSRQPGTDGKIPDSGENLLVKLHEVAGQFKRWFDKISSGGKEQFVAEWEKTVDNTTLYTSLLNHLIQRFGIFECITMSLPGTGKLTAGKKVQKHLKHLFEINTRHIRMLDLIHLVRKSWKKHPSKVSTGFFQPHTDVALMAKSMLMEYMLEADPVRMKLMMAEARRKGKSFVPYRFWRAAEVMRTLGEVWYGDPPQRHPTMTRNYVNADIRPVPTVCTDYHRLEWALREIFNNCIAATSQMFMTINGVQSKPLEKHAGENPSPAIRISVQNAKAWHGLKKRKVIRLIITDEGVGIDLKVLSKVQLWGFSVRRENLSVLADEEQESESDVQEMTIGGKGIGLPYTHSIVQEHGGHFSIKSKPGIGTTVTLELPITVPFAK